MKAKVQNVADKVKDKPSPSVYYVLSYGKMGDFTAGKDTFIGKMIQMAGGKMPPTMPKDGHTV
jgi:iron complex transport system substrate-binding protein